MKFLEQPPRFLFFTGRGGVGKTSIACATAIQLAAAGRRMLLGEDLRSPCTEEIAVFQAFSRIIREAGKKFVVMDAASRHARRYAVVPLLKEEPIGVARLLELVGPVVTRGG